MALLVAAGRRGTRRTAATGPRRQPDHGRRTRRSPDRRAIETGAVTAEAATVLPLLVAVVLALVWLLSLAAAQVRVVDAAREVARLAARGEPVAAAVEHGRQVAPTGAQFDVQADAQRVEVAVAAEVRGPGGLLAFLPGVEVRSHAVAAAEPQ